MAKLGESLAPKTSIRPQPRPSIDGEGNKSKGKGILEHPMLMAALLNGLGGMLSGQGLGQALGKGLSGAGRYAGLEDKRLRGNEQQEYERGLKARALAAAAAKRSGGGGGSGGGSGVASKDVNKEMSKLIKYYQDNEIPLPDVETLTGLATINALAGKGDPSVLIQLNSIEDPAARDAFAAMYAGGREKGDATLAAYMANAGAGAGEGAPGVAPGSPTVPDSGPGPSIIPPQTGLSGKPLGSGWGASSLTTGFRPGTGTLPPEPRPSMVPQGIPQTGLSGRPLTFDIDPITGLPVYISP